MWSYSFRRFLSMPILVIITLSNELSADESFAGCQVYSMTLASTDQANQLFGLAAKERMDIWLGPMIKGLTHVMVCETNKASLVSFAETNKIQTDIIVADVQQMIDKLPTFSKASSGSITWDAYYDLETTYAWMASVASKYPDMAKVETFGKTVEGRDMRMIVIGNGSKGFHLQCVIHAREWTTGPVCTWAINEFTTNRNNYKEILNNTKFYIVPVVNPDGYEFTKTDAIWRKNRGKTSDPNCIGTDLNRNFPYEWQRREDLACMKYYPGLDPNSEPETQAYIKHFSTHKDIQVFVDIHSYGQLVLHSWCFTSDKVPEDNDELTALGQKVANAIGAVNNNPYSPGNWPSLLYISNGVSIDWTYAVAKVKYSYTIELRRGGNSSNGWRLEEKYILPTVKECWAGIQVLINAMVESNGGQFNAIPSQTFSWLLIIAARICSHGLI